MASKTSTLLTEGDHIILSTPSEPWAFDCRFVAADAWGIWIEGGEFSPMPNTMYPWGVVDKIEAR